MFVIGSRIFPPGSVVLLIWARTPNKSYPACQRSNALRTNFHRCFSLYRSDIVLLEFVEKLCWIKERKRNKCEEKGESITWKKEAWFARIKKEERHETDRSRGTDESDRDEKITFDRLTLDPITRKRRVPLKERKRVAQRMRKKERGEQSRSERNENVERSRERRRSQRERCGWIVLGGIVPVVVDLFYGVPQDVFMVCFVSCCGAPIVRTRPRVS